MATKSICFQVNGTPKPRGSKLATLIPKRGGGYVTNANGRPVVAARDSCKQSKDWMRSVSDAARDAWGDALIVGPVAVEITLYFARPRSHYGSGRNTMIVKPMAPAYHAQRPDVDKLARAILDACTGQIWRDDSQVCGLNVTKRWTTTNERAVVMVEILAGCGKQE